MITIRIKTVNTLNSHQMNKDLKYITLNVQDNLRIEYFFYMIGAKLHKYKS